MGPIGMQEMIFIFVLALVLFGPKKLPELGRLLGRGLTEFRRAKNELRTTFESHMRELEREANVDKERSAGVSSYKPDYSSPRYPYPYDEHGQDTSANVETTVSSGVDELQPSSDSAAPQVLSATAVNGTVPRASGSQPVEHTPAESKAEEEHRPA